MSIAISLAPVSARARADALYKTSQEKQIRALKDANKKLEAEVAKLRSDKEALEEEVKSLKEQLQNAVENAELLRRELKEKDDEILKLRKQITALEEKMQKQDRAFDDKLQQEKRAFDDKLQQEKRAFDEKLQQEKRAFDEKLQQEKRERAEQGRAFGQKLEELDKKLEQQQEEHKAQLEAIKITRLQGVAEQDEREGGLRRQLGGMHRTQQQLATENAAQRFALQSEVDKSRKDEKMQDRLLLRQCMYRVRDNLVQKVAQGCDVYYLNELEHVLNSADVGERWNQLCPRFTIRRVDGVLQAVVSRGLDDAHPPLRVTDRAALERAAAGLVHHEREVVLFLIELMYREGWNDQ